MTIMHAIRDNVDITDRWNNGKKIEVRGICRLTIKLSVSRTMCTTTSTLIKSNQSKFY